MTIEDFRAIFAHGDWATDRLFAAAGTLSEADLTADHGGPAGPLLATLAHIVQAEETWLARWEGDSNASLGGRAAILSLNDLRERWEAQKVRRGTFLAGLTEECLHAPLPYRNSEGRQFAESLANQLLHVALHGQYHRGQATTLLTPLGVDYPATDYILHLRDGHSGVG